MDMLKDFLRDKSRAQLVMIGAIVVNVVSQFFLYLDDQGSAMLTGATDLDFYTTLTIFSFAQIGTGWELHPHAYVLLVGLAFVFLRDDIIDGAWFRKWGWWVAVLAILACTVPGAYFRATGAGIGGISLLIAIAGALLHRREERAMKVTAAKT